MPNSANNSVYVPSEDSDQPINMLSLIYRVFAVHTKEICVLHNKKIGCPS